MASVNKVILVGNLGADPEIRHTPGGKMVGEFRMATTFKSGETEQTEWHRVVVWEKLAEVAGNYLHKGNPVYVEGRIATRSWDKDDGTKGYVTEIIAERLQLLGAKPESAANTSSAAEDKPARKRGRPAKATQTKQEDFGAEDDPFAA